MFYFCKSIKKIVLFKWVKLPSGCVVPGSCVLIVTFGYLQTVEARRSK